MPIPTTFSAPSDETFPALNGFEPSPEDSLRYAVWLMLMADDVNRRAYSYDPDDAAKGVRISQGRPDYDTDTLALVLPCQIVQVAVSAGRWTYSTSKAGTLDITIGIAHIEAANTSKLPLDVAAPPITAETRLNRVRRILMRGTLHRESTATNAGKVIDPYRTPLAEDGTYAAPLVWMNSDAPEVTPARRVSFPNKRVRNDAELLAMDPVRDFAVSYGWLARYTVSVSDRDVMR